VLLKLKWRKWDHWQRDVQLSKDDRRKVA
jgi:hypothetical protein